jgi:hypothetical protein
MAKRAACLGALRDAPGRGSGSSVFAHAVARPLGGFAMMALRTGAPCPAGAGRETPLTRPVLLRQTRSARRFPGRPVRLLLGAGTAEAVLLFASSACPGWAWDCPGVRKRQAPLVCRSKTGRVRGVYGQHPPGKEHPAAAPSLQTRQVAGRRRERAHTASGPTARRDLHWTREGPLIGRTAMGGQVKSLDVV